MTWMLGPVDATFDQLRSHWDDARKRRSYAKVDGLRIASMTYMIMTMIMIALAHPWSIPLAAAHLTGNPRAKPLFARPGVSRATAWAGKTRGRAANHSRCLRKPGQATSMEHAKRRIGLKGYSANALRLTLGITALASSEQLQLDVASVT
ncbi:hypothetical protein BP5796_02597 [Coleophoma crateriformis]|uniref:Uncharacterized protein n=1 Tax=Coleophoma crateriformis TaxID=565419 RepID=A0A3D8SYP9_9HELO|nr:hypothetical protein BP5796_02597 [Coleophoma crateriformis]